MLCVFVFKQKTAYEMRISDWSSDVCSSDLMAHGLESRVPFMDNDLVDFAMAVPVDLKLGNLSHVVAHNENEPGPKTRKYFERTRDGKLLLREAMKIGRASCRERVCQYV